MDLNMHVEYGIGWYVKDIANWDWKKKSLWKFTKLYKNWTWYKNVGEMQKIPTTSQVTIIVVLVRWVLNIPINQIKMIFFSIVGLLITFWRCHLQTKHLDHLIFVGKNWPFDPQIDYLEPIDFVQVWNRIRSDRGLGCRVLRMKLNTNNFCMFWTHCVRVFYELQVFWGFVFCCGFL